MKDLQSSLGAQYRVERELGGGGMSRVFIAEDTALGRSIVVKVLPSEMAGHVSLERFKREISLAARLQHPHIVPVLAAGEADGLPYFTMPYIRGDSLRAHLVARGEMPVPDAVRILREIASALAFAHDDGIVHRDIKPENILLSSGSAMVTDFGVAKAIVAAGIDEPRDGALTSLGVALGTPAYMSPEQATASPTVDQRADIYSWGVVAYELLTGATPFVGRSTQAQLAAQVTEEPEPVEKRRAGMPPALAALVMRCLAKRAADRPQSAHELLRDLDAIATPSGGSPPTPTLPAPAVSHSPRARVVGAGIVVLVAVVVLAWGWRSGTLRPSTAMESSIAVLPFDNGGGDTTYAYLADGIADELRSGLTRVAPLRVKSRSASMRFRGSAADASVVGAKLDVGRILQGTLSRIGSRLHVTVDLVDVAHDNTLWSATFDRPATELGGIQDSIASAVVAELRVRTLTTAARAGGARGTADPMAYEMFLKARYATVGPEKAIRYLQDAVSRDPRFARAHATLAAEYALMTFPGLASRDSALALANESLHTAESIDSTLIEVLGARAALDMVDLHYEKARAAAATIVAMDSTNVDARLGYSTALGALGRVDEALVESRRAVALDPFSAGALINEQYYLLCLRRFREAIDVTNRITAIDSALAPAYENLAAAYIFLGKPDSALRANKQAFAVAKGAYGAHGSLVLAYAAAGQWANFDRERALAAHDPPGNSPYLGRVFDEVLDGNLDAAMAALEKSVANREPALGSISLSCELLLDPLKSHPRFTPLMQRLGIRLCPAVGTWPIPRPPRQSHRT